MFCKEKRAKCAEKGLDYQILPFCLVSKIAVISWVRDGHRNRKPQKRGPRGASHENFHAAPSKKQARILEGPLSLEIKGKATFLEAPLLLRRCCVELFVAYPLLLPSYKPQKSLWFRCAKASWHGDFHQNTSQNKKDPFHGRNKCTPPPYNPPFSFLWGFWHLYGVYNSFQTSGVCLFSLLSQRQGHLPQPFLLFVFGGRATDRGEVGCHGGGVDSSLLTFSHWFARISGFSSLFPAIAVLYTLRPMCWTYCDRWENQEQARNTY